MEHRSLETHRKRAKVVATIDLILSSMSMCFWMLAMIGLHFLRISVQKNQGRANATNTKILMNQPDFQDPPDAQDMELSGRAKLLTSESFYSCAWFLAAAFLMAAIIQITAAVKLLNATQIGKDARSAYALCRYWRSVCVMFTGLLLCDIVLSLRGKNFFAMSFVVCNMLIRTTQLYIVQHYMNELDSSLRTLPTVHHPNHLISVPVHFHIPVGSENEATSCRYVHYKLSAAHQEPKPQDLPPPTYEEVTKEPEKYEKI